MTIRQSNSRLLVNYIVKKQKVNLACVVVPVEGQSAEQFSFPVDREVLACFYCVYVVLGVLVGEVFHAEVVDAEDEGGFSCEIFPEAGSEGHGFVSGRGKFLYKLVECDDAGFF